jgi:hypothetical protein
MRWVVSFTLRPLHRLEKDTPDPRSGRDLIGMKGIIHYELLERNLSNFAGLLPPDGEIVDNSVQQ